MKTIWRALSAAGLIGLMLGVAAIEGGAPLLPTFTASLACVGALLPWAVSWAA